MKYLRILFFLFTISFVSIQILAQASKVDVCHYDADTGNYHLINISDNAFDRHVDHGDASPGEPVPTMAGYVFNETCIPVIVVVDSDGDGVDDDVDQCPNTPDLSAYGDPYVDTVGCVSLVGADLSGANLSDADLSGANLTDADLFTANLTNANLTGAILTDATLDFAILSRANLTGADLSGAYGASLYGADLTGALLNRANLTDADLSYADLTGALLNRADLTRADLSYADLTGADLTNANLTGVIWSNTICPNGTNSDDNGETC